PQEFIDESEESAEQVEERLRRRLIAYSRYRELGVQLRARQDEASGFYFRDSGDPTSELVQHYRIDPEKLKRAFIIMLQQARPEKREVVRERVSLLAQMDYISRKVKDQGTVSFFALCRELGMTREVIIVTFLAILELVRRHRIEFEQADIEDDIRLFPISHSVAQG
ncbi:MAG: segregation/condensation protein A, partial [Candidatus Aquilonibacter sp.]